MVKVAISQPTFLPFYGYFKLMKEVDKFVILDNVQFSKQSWQQRNKVQIEGKDKWLTIPVEQRLGQLIYDVGIGHKENLYKIYQTCKQYFNFIIPTEYNKLMQITMDGILKIKEKLNIDTEILHASLLNEKDILKICQMLDADQYISTGGSRVYFDDKLENDFLNAGITVSFRDYEPDYSIVQYLHNKEYLKEKELI